MLFTVDVYNPGFAQLLPDGPSEVLDAIETQGLLDAVQTIAGGHGGAGTLAELQQVVGGG